MSKKEGYVESRIRYNRVKSEVIWLDFYSLYYGKEEFPIDSISAHKEIRLKEIPIVGFEIIEEFCI